ncbi:MerR family transcriptional regulator [Saccharopolyspora elongata]|uniref:MerR family transcriptional regulator n=1 Tax=Saccharopolyspora elongata TaxID=2530387 RepID=A0A4R4Z9U7_9PSEU|nr:MerR family transcriptional regulator [Saccharopolyspora elongata]TDD55078.1 MerR family transcriptional regulator [Saccharopolyspora elongata]
MRSQELADLAGVTVRTLRHYHQIGLLPEPPRSSNGYRRYTAVHLVRLLRIRHLAELGVSLVDVPAMLDDESTDTSATILERVEAGIDSQIERLKAQRDLVRALRVEGRSPDIPADVHGDLTRLHDVARLPPDATRLDLDVATLMGHLPGSDVRARREELVAVGEHAQSTEFLDALRCLAEMPPDATDERRQRVADELRTHVQAIRSGTSSSLPVRAAPLIGQLLEQYLNAAQLDTFVRIAQ